MKEKDLLKLIERRESQTLEFKESLSLKEEIGEAVSAFSNTNSGIILVGVKDPGTIIGAEIGTKTLEGLANYLKQNTDNQVYPEITVETLDRKNVILITVEEAGEKPVFFRGTAYKRIGRSNHRLSASEIRNLAKECGKKVYWDEQICEGAGYDDIDGQAVKWFRRKYEKRSGKRVISSSKELLKSIGCIKESKITNAGILLFGKNPAGFFPRYHLSIARYPGRDIGTAYLEIKDIEGNLFEIIDKAERYIREHIETFHVLKKGQVAREPVLQYPDFVIRELIVNAVAHRDYSITGSRILIKMFRDRIEFDSPGGFAGNVNEKNILYEQFSRNPLIVKVLNRVSYIEEMGEGWNRIMKTIRDYPLEFGEMPRIKGTSRVVVTLFGPEELFEKEPLETDMQAVNGWLTRVDARLTQELSGREKEIVLFLLKNKRISSADCRKLLGISREMANRHFTRLIERKLIEKRGAGKYTYYVLR